MKMQQRTCSDEYVTNTNKNKRAHPQSKTSINVITKSLIDRNLTFRCFSEDSSMQQQSQDDHKHCVDLVESRDRDGYLAGLLLPDTPFEIKRSFYAVRAFNIEISQIKDASRTAGSSQSDNVSIGSKMRVQW
uniref:Uncharacterized protein n=1 Tax=Proboscia inermis TaxID=420281 RepID=A0A7S0C545_9STRA|mmetsp:Transcript_27936/g.28345  ORF Transcript_27936/g.28345 Transcript_27936/m.28345 type:complete len:132 (+) Transcript_27936:69-464(+)